MNPSEAFVRHGELMDIRSYPAWAQALVEDCSAARAEVADHALFHRMRDNTLSAAQIRAFLVGVWPVIEQFPQYMAQNLVKVQLGRAAGHDMARRYLIRNIRVEQNHADQWMAWSQAHGIALDELLHGEAPAEVHALSHWCWHSCERDPLAAGMAATNYAIEGVTGDWSALVCSSDTYEMAFPADVRAKAMKWLKLHARYDDEHPWEALDIICTILGQRPSAQDVALVRSRVLKSYGFMRLTLDHCLQAGGAVAVSRLATAEAQLPEPVAA